MTTVELRSPPEVPADTFGTVETSKRDLPRTGYRPDIDGLRAIAVLMVIGFHAYPSWVPGGFIGVDVFFVISGYLISTIILTDLEQHRFSFLRFYGRRINRIFPALALVLLTSLVIGWLVLFPLEYQQLGEQVAASAGFVQNLLLWREAGYFDTAAASKPLLHLWSLGVEEQFYIIWPFILFFAARFRANLLFVISTILVASFAFNAVTIGTDKIAGFYSPLTRFWELLAGASLAFQSMRMAASEPVWLINVRSVLGAAFFVAALGIINANREFPGWWALLPVAGTYLIISAGRSAWLNKVFLANPVMVWVGLISYPLYLWHWLIISFSRIVNNGAALTPYAATVAVLGSIVLAWMTFALVEKPIRFGNPVASKVMPLVVLLVGIGSTGLYVKIQGGFAFRQWKVEKILDAAEDSPFPLYNGHYHGVPAPIAGDSNGDEILLIGDSTLQQYWSRADELMRTNTNLKSQRIVLLGQPACLTIPDIRSVRQQWNSVTGHACSDFMETILPLLYGEHVKKVVIGTFWSNQFNLADFYLKDDGPDQLLAKSAIARQHAIDKIANLTRQLTAAGKKVFIILETPTGAVFDPRQMLPTGWMRLYGKPNIPANPFRDSVERVTGGIDGLIASAALQAGAKIIDPMETLCNQSDCPVTDKNGRPNYYDYDHLNATFVRKYATYMDQIFQ